MDRNNVAVFMPIAVLQLGTLAFMANVAMAQEVSPPESLAYEI
jgi:hypothetical protein